MKFKTKDLLVTVLPKLDKDLAKVCLLATKVCRFPTIDCKANTLGCLTLSVGCPTLSIGCNPCSIMFSKNCLDCSFVSPCKCSFASPCNPCSVAYSPCGICSTAISGGCQIFNSCGPDGSVCDPTIFCPGASSDPFVIRDREDIVILRAELQETLKGLEAMERELPSSFASREEAEAVERSLTEALKRVQAAKKDLK